MKEKDEKRGDIRDRTFEYALRAIKLHQFLQNSEDEAGRLIARQYLRSATSIGANMEEAQSGESKADFVHKCGIAQKEARESLYWLKLLATAGLVEKKRIGPLMEENDEIVAIITRIIVNTKKGMNKKG